MPGGWCGFAPWQAAQVIATDIMELPINVCEEFSSAKRRYGRQMSACVWFFDDYLKQAYSAIKQAQQQFARQLMVDWMILVHRNSGGTFPLEA